MGRFKSLLIASSAAVLLTSGIAVGQGIVPDRSTIVTISAPVSVPGVVLPAGEYLFRLADSNATRNVVQIFNKDRSKIFATLITVSAERDRPEGEAVVTFRETPADQPPALRYWYYAGEKAGQEFAYPKSQALAIARTSHESVMAMDTTASDAESMQKAELSRIDPNSPEVTAAEPAAQAQPSAQAQPTEPAPPAVEKPAVEKPEVEKPAVETPAPPTQPEPQTAAPPAAQPQTPTPQEPATPPTEPKPTGTSGRDMTPAPAGTSGRTAAAPSDSARELPKTASELPLIGLLGVIALAGALGLRAYRRQLS